jgi:TolB-like protein
MKKKPASAGLFFIFLILSSAIPCFSETSRVLLPPFSVYSESSMDFLKKGAGDLIETRLSGKDIQVVRTETEMAKNDAMKQAVESSADTFVSGSLTFLGNTISINALLIDAKTGQTLVSYTKADSDKDRLFSHISEFADQAADHLKKPAPVADVKPDAPVAAPVVPVPAAPVVVPPSSSVLTAGTKRSQDLPVEITALAVGDVDGDKTMDIVYSDRHNFTVASFKEKSLDIKKVVEGKNYLDILFVDTFDANKNGLPEIFVTSVHIKTNKVSSTVYEWNGKDFQILKSDLPYFFRAGKSPETGSSMLLGQEQHMAQDIFGDAIFEMIWSAGRQNYIPLKTLKIPEKNLYIYGMDTGDLKNSGMISSVVYLPGDHLAVVDFRKQSSWKSPIPYGGSYKFIEPKAQENNERFYIPPRLLAGDFDNNKTQEFATIVNTNSTPKMFSNLRKYVQGRVECLEWKSLRFETLWKTQDVSGYIPDFAIADMNGDGVNDVVFPVVEKGGFFLGKDSTYIVIQPISF